MNAPSQEPGFKAEHKKSVALIHDLIGIVLFLAGIAFRLWGAGKEGFQWEALREIGSFLAVTVAVTFVYERVIHARERKLFLDDIDRLLERKLRGEQRGLTLYENGRPPLEDKAAVIDEAKSEVVEIGTALRTFVGYFETRPSAEFKDRVTRLLRAGVNFRCVIMDPTAAKTVDAQLGTKCADSLTSLRHIRDEFSAMKLKGSFEIRVSHHASHFAAICVDGDAPSGRIFFSPYLYKEKNAEAPTILITKSDRPILFAKLWQSVKRQLADAPVDVPAAPMAAHSNTKRH